MSAMLKPYVPAIAVGAVLGVGLPVLANTVELPAAVLLILFVATVGAPAVMAADASLRQSER